MSIMHVCVCVCLWHATYTGVIINNKHFTCGMKDRVGTDRDADALQRLFAHLGFYTNRYDDLKGKDMKKRLRVGAARHAQSGSHDASHDPFVCDRTWQTLTTPSLTVW